MTIGNTQCIACGTYFVPGTATTIKWIFSVNPYNEVSNITPFS